MTTGRIGWSPDYKQPSLFDDAIVTKRLCPSCRTTRPNLCRHDADVRHEAIARTVKRPKGCLNAPNPTTDPWPDGY